ncbi:MAG TPA: chloride channel protein, partial [Microbacteriaceae bacterium]|nr:chloride channel protein [Microbacteriaceae bacterium]
GGGRVETPLTATVRVPRSPGLRGWLRLDRPVSVATTPPRMWLLCAAGLVLGLAAGGAAVALFIMIGFLTHLTLLHDIGTDLPTLRGWKPTLWIIPTAVAGAFVVSLFAKWSPVIRGHGIPESLEAILTRHSRIRPRAAVAKPISAVITIGTGGPFGAEGPIIVTGGSFGSLLGQVLSVSPAERKILLATGAAAGMAATFNTPVAAVILAVELVLFERSLRTIVPLALACGVAASVHILAFGTNPLFFIPGILHVSFLHLPWFLLVGLASGIMAVILNKGLFLMEAGFRHLPVNIFWWPMIGALIYSVIGYFEPRTLSMGNSAIIDTIEGHFVLGAVAVLFVAKLFSWWVALGSQTSGGTLAPMFLVGALMGSLIGHGVNAVFPAANVSTGAFALAAMAAVFGASTKAVLASVIFAAEVTGQYQMVIPLLIATAVADLVAQVGLGDRIMTEKLSHRGFRVDFDMVTDVLRQRLVRHAMRGPVTIPATATVANAHQLLVENGLNALAVADSRQKYVGLATDAIVAAAPPDALMCDIPLADQKPTVRSDYLDIILTRMTNENLDALPVVQDGTVVGLITQGHILAYRHHARALAETRQPGWWATRHEPRKTAMAMAAHRATERATQRATRAGSARPPAARGTAGAKTQVRPAPAQDVEERDAQTATLAHPHHLDGGGY